MDWILHNLTVSSSRSRRAATHLVCILRWASTAEYALLDAANTNVSAATVAAVFDFFFALTPIDFMRAAAVHTTFFSAHTAERRRLPNFCLQI
jgi:hypothetical protein